jgi:hypothetical protein
MYLKKPVTALLQLGNGVSVIRPHPEMQTHTDLITSSDT